VLDVKPAGSVNVALVAACKKGCPSARWPAGNGAVRKHPGTKANSNRSPDLRRLGSGERNLAKLYAASNSRSGG